MMQVTVVDHPLIKQKITKMRAENILLHVIFVNVWMK